MFKWQYFMLIMMFVVQAFAPRPGASFDPGFGSSSASGSNPLLETLLKTRELEIAGNSAKIPFPKKSVLQQIESDDTVLDPSSITDFDLLPVKKVTKSLNYNEEIFLWNLVYLHNSLKEFDAYASSKIFHPNNAYYRYMLLYLVKQPNQVVRAKHDDERVFHNIEMTYSEFMDKRIWAQEVVERLVSVFNKPTQKQNSWITQSLVKSLLTGQWPQDAEASSAVSHLHDETF